MVEASKIIDSIRSLLGVILIIMSYFLKDIKSILFVIPIFIAFTGLGIIETIMNKSNKFAWIVVVFELLLAAAFVFICFSIGKINSIYFISIAACMIVENHIKDKVVKFKR